MALPVQSIRAKPEHRSILRDVAESLRSGNDANLRYFLANPAAAPVGPFRDEASAIAFMRDRLVAELKPKSIWLFGSRARGTARPDSDFDLLVVLPDGLREDCYSHEAVARPLVACGLGCDVVPTSWSVFAREKNEAGTFVHAIATGGREIYRDRALRQSTGR